MGKEAGSMGENSSRISAFGYRSWVGVLRRARSMTEKVGFFCGRLLSMLFPLCSNFAIS